VARETATFQSTDSAASRASSLYGADGAVAMVTDADPDQGVARRSATKMVLTSARPVNPVVMLVRVVTLERHR
jgi:hypothetical protein